MGETLKEEEEENIILKCRQYLFKKGPSVASNTR